LRGSSKRSCEKVFKWVDARVNFYDILYSMDEKPNIMDEEPRPTELPKEPPKEETFLQEFEEKSFPSWVKILGLSLGAALITLGGVVTGGWLAGKKPVSLNEGGKPKIIKTEKVVGSTDVKTFRDSAEGVLESGGIDGEGTHHLVRAEGRPDQNAYLTSSVVNLDDYVGKKVKVFGETFTAQKAGLLMDVGKIELLE